MTDLAHANPSTRLVVVSNRLPFVLTGHNGARRLLPGSGGLVSALAPVLRNRGGVWIGWPGATGEDEGELEAILAEASREAGYSLRPVALSEHEKQDFYHGFSNEVIWPLFHDLHSHCNFLPRYWDTYCAVNRKFADAILRHSRSSDFVWVHDYHLLAVGQELRAARAKSKVGFFLHIPFPPLDIYLKLPWRFQILHALLAYDLIGFQTVRDRRNFMQCLRTLIPEAVVFGKGQVLTARLPTGREVRLGAFPIGIHFGEYARRAESDEVAERGRQLRADLPGRQIILGVDRLDYTKGICERFEAFRNALTRYPEMRRRVTLVQVVVPSREDIPKYHALKMEMDRLVGEINGQFTCSGWVPIHYMFRSLDRIELLGYYRAADIALVTPLKDGMNLVAKEYCAANIEDDGVLLLSEFAGAAAQLQKGALLVNPYNVEGVADGLYRAFAMSPEERRARMRKLRRSVRDYDIFWWVDSFLRAVIAKDLSDFPQPEEYVPQTENFVDLFVST